MVEAAVPRERDRVVVEEGKQMEKGNCRERERERERGRGALKVWPEYGGVPAEGGGPAAELRFLIGGEETEKCVNFVFIINSIVIVK